MHAVTMCHFYQTVGWSNNLVLNGCPSIDI